MPVYKVRRRVPLVLLMLAVLTPVLPMALSALAFSNGQAASLELGWITSARRLYQPHGIAVDPTTGSIFVADTDNNRILRFASPAALTNNAAAEGVLGQPGFTSRAAATTAQGMRAPKGVAVDKDGRLWVADTGNNRILRFDAAASKAAGAAADSVLGQQDFTSKWHSTGQSTLDEPSGVAVDDGGRLWVADTINNRVLRFDNAAAKPIGARADGVLGRFDFSNGEFFQTNEYEARRPTGLLLDGSGRLWVSDTGNHRVLRYDNAAAKPNGAPADGVLGQPSMISGAEGTTAKSMSRPIGLAGDAEGRLWVADEGNSRVLRFDNAASKPIWSAADRVLGQRNFSSKTATTSAQAMANPRGVVLDSDGRLWVTDGANGRVLRFDAASSKPSGAAADGVLGQPDFSSGLAGLFGAPGAVVVDPVSGKVFVADPNNNRVFRFASRASLNTGANAEAVLGQPNFATTEAATSAQGMYSPGGLAIDRDGRLWVVDSWNYRVLRFDSAATKPSGAPADGVLGQVDFTSRAAATSAQGMYGPFGVAVDGDGRLWVADGYNNRVLRFDNAAAKPNGTPADGVLGQPDFTSDTAATTAAGMHIPDGMAVDGDGRLWVADRYNHRVLRFDSAASKPSGAPADGVLGQVDFTSGTAATSAQKMYYPGAVAVDKNGGLWVADARNSRVLHFSAAASLPNGALADGVLGQPDFTSDMTAVTPEGMYYPNGVEVDGDGRLWVADSGSQRVLLFEDTVFPTSTPTPTGTLTSTPTASTTPTSTSTSTPTPTSTRIPTVTPTSIPASLAGLTRTDGKQYSTRCQYAPGQFLFSGVVALPAGYQTAKLQVNWSVMNPAGKRTSPVYQSWTVQSGASVSLPVSWPGIDPGDTDVRVSIGSVLLDPTTLQPIAGTSRSFSEYWTPQVCPAPTPVPAATSTPTASPTATSTPTPASTSTPTATPTASSTPTSAPTASPTQTSTPISTPTATPALAAGLTRTDSKQYSSRCQYAPGQLLFSGVVGLPVGYQTARLQVNWYVTSPASRRTNPVYQSWTVQSGASVSLPVSWPGIEPGDTEVRVYIGSVLLDPVTLQPISGTSRSFSEYWTPQTCPAPTPTPTPS